jgi:hypothetical protein
MASNKTPESYDPVVELLEDAADGAHDHGAAVGLKQNDETALRGALVDLVGKPAGPNNVPPAEPGLKALWNTAKQDKATKTGLFRTAKSNGRAIASACVGVLKPRLGGQWNNQWQSAGFTTGSLEIPDNPLTLLQQLRAYFTANPTHEIPNLAPGIAATAVACEAAAQAISDASTASNASNTAAGTAKNNLEAGIKTGRSRLSGLRDELTQLIGPDDERWYSFGFDKPSDPETPEVPENLTAVAGAPGSGRVFVDFDDARRAESYRVRVVNVATTVQVAEQLVEDSDANFASLPLGVAFRITATAINAAGESQPSEPVTITLA